MLGAFRSSSICSVGLLWSVDIMKYSLNVDIHTKVFFFVRKTPWRLSVTRKANARKRLKQVDSVIEAVRASGIQCGALVCALCT
jgi:hypothetical protein